MDLEGITIRPTLAKLPYIKAMAKVGESDTRPWGSWETIAVGTGWQVKILRVNPQARLSLQSHKHRAEHWVVTRGTAEVVVDDKTLRLEVGESIDIPQGAKHRLGNPNTTPLEITEVQFGAILEESDIVRHEDDYGRS